MGHNYLPSERHLSLVRECGRIGFNLHGHVADVAATLAKDADHRPAAVVTTPEHRRSQSHEPPEEFESLRRVRPGYLLDDRAALGIEVTSKGSGASPVRKGFRPRDGGEALAY